jgi:hypothetical protein
MARLKTLTSRRRRSLSKDDITLAEALERVDDPTLASSLSVFYAELARAQTEGDRQGADYARRAIAEAMRGVPEGEIDLPLLPLLRRRANARKR